MKVGRHAGILDAQGDLRRADQAEFSVEHIGRHRRPTVTFSTPPTMFQSPTILPYDYWRRQGAVTTNMPLPVRTISEYTSGPSHDFFD